MQFTDNPISEVADVKKDPSHDNVVEMFAQLGASVVTQPEPLTGHAVPAVFVVNAGSQMHARQILTRDLATLDLVDGDTPGVITFVIPAETL